MSKTQLPLHKCARAYFNNVLAVDPEGYIGGRELCQGNKMAKLRLFPLPCSCKKSLDVRPGIIYYLNN